jgi:O-antigen ligase
MTKNCRYFFTLIIIMLPAALVSGPLIPDLIVSISSLFFLIIIIKKKLYYLFNNIYFKIFFFFWLLLIFSSLLSIEKKISLQTSFFYIRFGIFSLLVFYLLNNDNKFGKYFFYSVLATFLVVIFDTYIQYFTGRNTLGFRSHEAGARLSGFFNKELIVGSYIARMLPLVISFFFLFKYRYAHIFINTLFVLANIIVFLSGERTSFSMIIIINILYIFLIKEYRFTKILTFIFSILIICFLAYNNVTLKKRMVSQTFSELTILPNLDRGNSSSFLLSGFFHEKFGITIFTEQHEQHIDTAFRMFLDHKFFGVGPKMFRYNCADQNFNSGKWSCTTHPHNTHIQILAETGLVGYSIFIYVFFQICKIFVINFLNIFVKFRKIYNSNQIFLLISFFITLFPFYPGGNFFNNWLSIIYYLPVGFYLHSVYYKK